MSNPVPSKIGSCRPIQLIYSGQGTRLWKAYDDAEHREVMIKMLSEKAARDREQVRYLRREYNIAAELNFPGAVSPYEWGVQDGCPYFAMEYVSAPSVKQLIHLGYENYASVLTDLIPKLFEPLAALNNAGYVHRDIKPDNFLYTPEMGVRLIDYALVQKAGGLLQRLLPKAKTTQGTATYMSPEQIRKLPLDQRADLYCLGGTIYELLSGMPPFTGNSMAELLQKHINGTIAPITSKNKNVTPKFAEFLHSLLAVDPAKRPARTADAWALAKNIPIFINPPKGV